MSAQAAPAAIPHLAFARLRTRVAAHLLDALIAVSVLVLAGLTMRSLRAAGLWTPVVVNVDPVVAWKALSGPAKLAITFSFILAMGPIYHMLFEASAWQATWGKRLLKIYVVDAEGKQVGNAKTFERWFFKEFFGIVGLGLISVITIAVTRRKQALHDFTSNTLVVRGRPPNALLEPWRIVVSFGIPYLVQIATLFSLF